MAKNEGLFSKFHELIIESRFPIVALDANMDLDALGASLALSALFEHWEKQHCIVAAKPVPDVYLSIQNLQQIMVTASLSELSIVPDTIVIPDVGSFKQLGELFTNNKEYFSAARVVHIDHHIESDISSDLTIIDSKAVSTCELIAMMYKFFNFPAQSELLTILLTGIISDSRSFSTPKVSSYTFGTASWLLDEGADAVVASRLAKGHTFNQLKLWGLVLAEAERICGGKVGLATITREMVEKCGNNTAKTSGLVNLLDETLELSASVLLREEPSGEIRASFRSPGKLKVVKIARKFGGGGHTFAAACSLGYISLAKAKEVIIDEFELLTHGNNE